MASISVRIMVLKNLRIVAFVKLAVDGITVSILARRYLSPCDGALHALKVLLKHGEWAHPSRRLRHVDLKGRLGAACNDGTRALDVKGSPVGFLSPGREKVQEY
jgi:hypothetical protein